MRGRMPGTTDFGGKKGKGRIMEQVKKGKKKGLIIALAALILVVASLLVVNSVTRAKAQAGAKQLAIEIALPDGSVTEHVLHTDAETLGAAMNEASLITGHTEALGFFIDSVGGVVADPAKGEWWVFTKDGEWVTTGVNDTLIADGEHYEFSIYAG